MKTFFERELGCFWDREGLVLTIDRKPIFSKFILPDHQTRIKDLSHGAEMLGRQYMLTLLPKPMIVGKVLAGSIESWIQEAVTVTLLETSKKVFGEIKIGLDVITPTSKGEWMYNKDIFSCHHVVKTIMNIKLEQEKTPEEKIQDRFAKHRQKLYTKMDKEYTKETLMVAAREIGLYIDPEWKKAEMLQEVIQYALDRNLITF